MNIDNENRNSIEMIIESNEENNEENNQENEYMDIEAIIDREENLNEELSNLTYNINTYRNTLERFNRSMYLPNYNNNLDFLNNRSSNIFNEILNRTFYDKCKYKNILSEKGNNDLKRVKYFKSENEKNNSTCPIYQTEFNEGMEIIKLPCEHCFIPEAIEKWLKEENAICPVCRLKLDSIEIKNEENEENENENSEQQEIDRSTSFLFDSLTRSYNFPINDPLWRINSSERNINNDVSNITNNLVFSIMNQIINEEDETNLQQALYNSLNNDNLTN